jgi:hypothetical protein
MAQHVWPQFDQRHFRRISLRRLTGIELSNQSLRFVDQRLLGGGSVSIFFCGRLL